MSLLSLIFGLTITAVPADWQEQPCQTGAPQGARCGVVAVQENRLQPGGRQVSLNVMVLPSMGPAKYPPLYELAGGPGVHATASAVFYATDGQMWRQGRDVVLLDQRGTGGSGALRCPELETAAPLTRMYPPDAVRRCRETLSRQVDLTRFGTADAAADLEAVRRVLGHERIDLFGMSYGTMLAQAYMQLYPGRVRAAVLTGTVPLQEPIPLHHAANAQRLLDLLLDDCAREAACAAAFPDLKGDWGRLLARLEDGPITVPLKDGAVLAERGPVLEALRSLMTMSGGQQRIPLIIHRGAAGDFAPLAKAVGGGGEALPEGMYLSVVCPEATGRITDEQARTASAGTFLGDYRVAEQRGACREWVQGSAPERDMSLPQGPKVLFLVGGRDHVADPAWADQIAARLPGSQVVRLEPMSHGVAGVEGVECFDMLSVGFLADERLDEGELACIARMRAPPFATQ